MQMVMDSIHTTHTHTDTHTECGLNEQGVPARSIHALLVYGCLQHNSARSWYKNMRSVVWWVTAGGLDHLCSGLYCISWWSALGIIACVWQIGSLTDVQYEKTGRRFVDERVFWWSTCFSSLCRLSGQWVSLPVQQTKQWTCRGRTILILIYASLWLRIIILSLSLTLWINIHKDFLKMWEMPITSIQNPDTKKQRKAANPHISGARTGKWHPISLSCTLY